MSTLKGEDCYATAVESQNLTCPPKNKIKIKQAQKKYDHPEKLTYPHPQRDPCQKDFFLSSHHHFSGDISGECSNSQNPRNSFLIHLHPYPHLPGRSFQTTLWYLPMVPFLHVYTYTYIYMYLYIRYHMCVYLYKYICFLTSSPTTSSTKTLPPPKCTKTII